MVNVMREQGFVVIPITKNGFVNLVDDDKAVVLFDNFYKVGMVRSDMLCFKDNSRIKATRSINIFFADSRHKGLENDFKYLSDEFRYFYNDLIFVVSKVNSLMKSYFWYNGLLCFYEIFYPTLSAIPIIMVRDGIASPEFVISDVSRGYKYEFGIHASKADVLRLLL